MHHAFDIASGEVVGFEVVAVDVFKPCLVGFYEGAHDYACRHLAYAHEHELHQGDFHAAYAR